MNHFRIGYGGRKTKRRLACGRTLQQRQRVYSRAFSLQQHVGNGCVSLVKEPALLAELGKKPRKQPMLIWFMTRFNSCWRSSFPDRMPTRKPKVFNVEG